MPKSIESHLALSADFLCAWMVEAGANPKDVQGQIRHSRFATTLDIYAQHVPESQERAIAKMVEMVEAIRHAQFAHLKPDVVIELERNGTCLGKSTVLSD